MKKNRLYYILFLLIILGPNCNDRGTSNNGNMTDRIYLDYQVWGQEDGVATCMLQYRNRNHNGNALLIAGSGKVQLDGHTLEADSTTFTGPYYEYISPVEQFAGKHTISFSGIDRKVNKVN